MSSFVLNIADVLLSPMSECFCDGTVFSGLSPPMIAGQHPDAQSDTSADCYLTILAIYLEDTSC